jgi:hypothetical protein
LAAVLAAGVVACGGEAPDERVERGGSEPEADDRAWVAEFCRDVARRTGPDVLCIGRRPRRVDPPERLYRWQPSRSGYIVEGGAHGTHWVFAGSSARDDLGGYRPWRAIGSTVVRGRRARWLQASDASGIHAGHLMLTWTEDGHRYVLSAHADSRRMRRALRSAAEAMRPAAAIEQTAGAPAG